MKMDFDYSKFCKRVGDGVVSLVGVAACGAAFGGAAICAMNVVSERIAESETANEEQKEDKPQTYATLQHASLSRSHAVEALTLKKETVDDAPFLKALSAQSSDAAEIPQLQSYKPASTGVTTDIKPTTIALYSVHDYDVEDTPEAQKEFGEKFWAQERERVAQYKENLKHAPKKLTCR